jgi:vitamin B12 transporter
VGFRPDEKIHLYASVARAFKAPTLKHLYDSAPIFNPMSGTYIDISNMDLEPMVGTNSEVGVKLTEIADLDISLSYFYYRIRNEIDFDNATYSYRNIGRSRHSGIELSMKRSFLTDFHAGADLSYNSSVFSDGAFLGNQLNGVPTVNYRLRAAWQYSTGGTIAIRTEGIAREYINQENTIRLPDWTVLSLDASYSVRTVSIHAAIDNLLDKKYNVSGYFDPMIFESRYYPAAIRTITLSISSSL